MNHPKQVLFLCSGNYYRSRFAEMLFNALAAQTHLPWVADSSGLAVDRPNGNLGPIAAPTLSALRARNIDPVSAAALSGAGKRATVSRRRSDCGRQRGGTSPAPGPTLPGLGEPS